MQRSKSIVAALDRRHEILRADDVGARLARFVRLRAAREHRDAHVRPVPFGRLTTPRTIWSACFGSTPRLSESSTVSSNLAVALVFTSFTASSSL